MLDDESLCCSRTGGWTGLKILLVAGFWEERKKINNKGSGGPVSQDGRSVMRVRGRVGGSLLVLVCEGRRASPPRNGRSQICFVVLNTAKPPRLERAKSSSTSSPDLLSIRDNITCGDSP
jgi:hypothetical protein